MTPQEEAKKRARLLNAWADKETLQYRLVGVWTDYDGIEIPRISHSCEWRIKPRRMWMSRVEALGCSHSFDETEAKEWKRQGMPVTEWQEVVK